jgi:uncharacterized protein (TIGR02246 family)
MIKKLSFMLVVALFSVNVYANTCTTPTQEQVAGLFDRWNSSLATLSSKEVAKNYAKDSVLHPTLLNKMLVDEKGKKAYFDDFLKKKPQGKILERKIYTGCNYAVDTGIYQFALTDKEGKVSTADARYTYVYELQKGEWLIINHVSALVPADKK